MSLTEYEGQCTVCGQRITWKPMPSLSRVARPAYVFRHDGMLETISGAATLNLSDVSPRLHAENQDH